MKRVQVPNLAQVVKSELLVAVMGRERPTIPALHDERPYGKLTSKTQYSIKTGAREIRRGPFAPKLKC